MAAGGDRARRRALLILAAVVCLMALAPAATAQEADGGATPDAQAVEDCWRQNMLSVPRSVCEELLTQHDPETTQRIIACSRAGVLSIEHCTERETSPGLIQGVVARVSQGIFEQLYEWVAAGAAWAIGQLVSLIDSSTRPNVTADWFGRQYRLMGSLAIALITPLLMVCTISAVVRQDWRGLMRSYFVYLPAAMVGTAIAIPLVDMAVGITDWMSALFVEPLRGDIDAFTSEVTGALGSTGVPGAAAAAAGPAPFLLFLGAVLIALGAFAVWVELVLRAAGIYVALFFLPLGFAALVWPATRKWFGRLVKALVALILSKFVIVAVIALAAAALANLGTGDGTGLSGVIAGAALMLMAAFSPLVLFRVADVAGDEVASAIEGVTQHRTSPVPTPSAQQSASKMYGRIMSTRAAGEGAGVVAGDAKAASAGGAAAATGGAAVAAGAVATAVRAPGAAGEAASQRLDDVAHPNGNGQAATGNGQANGQRPSGRPPAAASSGPGSTGAQPPQGGQRPPDRPPPPPREGSPRPPEPPPAPPPPASRPAQHVAPSEPPPPPRVNPPAPPAGPPPPPPRPPTDSA